MITDEDRQRLSDVMLKALDRIEEYGDDAELMAATLVYECRVPDHAGWEYHGNYNSTEGTTPAHAGGMAQQLANWLLTGE